MNNKHFNQFKNYASGSTAGGSKGIVPLILGLGLLWLGSQSIYSGI
jgi:hypothetical protein